MKKILTVAAMRDADASTIAAGTPGRVLMARAAEGIVRAERWRGPVGIVCGSGNNAGDGFALALLLKEAGIPCALLRLSGKFSADGQYYYEKCIDAGIPDDTVTSETDLTRYRTLVDCVFGTGFHGEPTGLAAETIEKLNRSGARIVSADIPSGLHGQNGLGDAVVQADKTVSIGFPQPGHYLNRAKDCVGDLLNVDIGIPAPERYIRLAEEGDFLPLLKPRKQFSNKGNYGYVALIGGCRSYSGAAKLASLSLSALKCGCGVSMLAVPGCIADSVTPYLLESTLVSLPDADGFMRFDASALDGILRRVKAVSLGLGWGMGPDNGKILDYILQSYSGVLVLDADGLNTLAAMPPDTLRNALPRCVLTPHLREFSRLSGLSMEEIQADPVRAAERYASENHVILLLKGPATIVTDGQETWLTDAGCAGMATAGSGDVLTGVLCGLLGWAEYGVLSVTLGAYLAGKAGELAQAETGDISMTAGDTVKKIPQVIQNLRQTNRNED